MGNARGPRAMDTFRAVSIQRRGNKLPKPQVRIFCLGFSLGLNPQA
jgi:hypothetical protein